MRAPDRFMTPRLSARRIDGSDLQYVISVDTDPLMVPWLSGTTSSAAESEARLQRWLDEERQTGLGFWIFFDGSEPVGHGGLFSSKRDPNHFELGYAILPAHWGRGYATEIAQAFLRMARELQVAPVVAITRVANERSRRVLEKCGLRFDREFYADDTHCVRYALD